VQLIIEACRGLTVVHEGGLVHRDLKPENLFITRRAGGEDWCKVLDFGVAKMEASLSTAQGAIVGTVRYMAPEQLSDGAAIGPATDVYALGAILYECLCGKAAHAGETVQEVMFSVMNGEPEALEKLQPALPPELVAVVRRCLVKHPGKRPPGPAELERLLAPLNDRRSPATSNTTESDQSPLPRWPRPRSALAVAMPILLAGVAGAGIAWLAKPARVISSQVAARPMAMSSGATAAQPRRGGDVPAASTPNVAAPLPLPISPSAARAAPSVPTRVDKLHATRGKIAAASSATIPARTQVGRFDAANPYGNDDSH
jgi:serine/threonine protein kinase